MPSPVLSKLRKTNRAIAAAYPGETGDRQPVHSVYGGAHLFKADSALKIGSLALAALDDYAPDGATLARSLGLGEELAETIRPRIVEKLEREAVEDFRIDFEDGYGTRPDAEEDGHARSVAEEVATGLAAGTLPPFIGIRIKPMSSELHQRSLRTLDLFVSTLVKKTRGKSTGELRGHRSKAHGARDMSARWKQRALRSRSSCG